MNIERLRSAAAQLDKWYSPAPDFVVGKQFFAVAALLRSVAADHLYERGCDCLLNGPFCDTLTSAFAVADAVLGEEP